MTATDTVPVRLDGLDFEVACDVKTCDRVASVARKHRTDPCIVLLCTRHADRELAYVLERRFVGCRLCEADHLTAADITFHPISKDPQ